jgi:hypothetical protein
MAAPRGHQEAKCQWKSEPVSWEHVRLGRFDEGARSCRLDQAVEDEDNHNYEVSAMF